MAKLPAGRTVASDPLITAAVLGLGAPKGNPGDKWFAWHPWETQRGCAREQFFMYAWSNVVVSGNIRKYFTTEETEGPALLLQYPAPDRTCPRQWNPASERILFHPVRTQHPAGVACLPSAPSCFFWTQEAESRGNHDVGPTEVSMELHLGLRSDQQCGSLSYAAFTFGSAGPQDAFPVLS